MKKLLIAGLMVAMAGMVHAATVNWNSGSLYRATSVDGGWGTTGVKSGIKEGTSLAVSVYLVDETKYTAAGAMSQKDLYDTYKGATASASNSVNNKNAVTASTAASPATISDTADYYAVVIYTYTDTDYGEMMMATTATIARSLIDNDGNTYDVANIGKTIGVATTDGGWQAVPEPTSGLLMMVGCALLALKRKRA